MRKGDQCVLYPMKEKTWTFGLTYIVYISKSFKNDKTHESCPPKQTFSCIFNTGIWRHHKYAVTVFETWQVTCWSTPHTSSKYNNVLLLNTANCGQVVIYWLCIFPHHLLVWFAALVKAIARIFYRQYMHLCLLAKHIEQIKCQPNIFSITMEVNY